MLSDAVLPLNIILHTVCQLFDDSAIELSHTLLWLLYAIRAAPALRTAHLHIKLALLILSGFASLLQCYAAAGKSYHRNMPVLPLARPALQSINMNTVMIKLKLLV